MVWLAKWIKENINNSRILIITDRDELDKQIEKEYADKHELTEEETKKSERDLRKGN